MEHGTGSSSHCKRKILPPRFQLETGKNRNTTYKKLDISSYMQEVGFVDQLKRDFSMVNNYEKTQTLNTYKEKANDKEQNIYNAASKLVLEEEKSAETTLQCFEQRVAVWEVACIPCSFHQRRPIERYHSNSLQDQHSYMIDQFWLKIKFDCYIGCF